MAHKVRGRKVPGNIRGKYLVRRVMLVLVIIALVVAGSVYLGYLIARRDMGGSIGQSDGSQLEVPLQVVTPEPSSSEDESREDESAAEEAMSMKVDTEAWSLLLVNKKHRLPDDFTVDLVKVVDEYKVDARIEEPLLRMFAGAREDGITLMLCSAYRSTEYQTQLFDNKKNELVTGGMKEEEAIATTATIITNPGTSEHHTGLAVDIVTPEYQNLDEGFENTHAFKWLKDNAAEYGFILRYPKNKQDITDIIYEPWHYRYVGADVAKEINELGVCLEEYIEAAKTDSAPVESNSVDESSSEAD